MLKEIQTIGGDHLYFYLTCFNTQQKIFKMFFSIPKQSAGHRIL